MATNEYEIGRHAGVGRAIIEARATVAAIEARRRKAEGETVDDATFQYGSGMANGAREVLRRLEELDEDLRVHEAARS